MSKKHHLAELQLAIPNMSHPDVPVGEDDKANLELFQGRTPIRQLDFQPLDHVELAEKLVDLEDYFRRWRFNHVTTVERVIGFKQGTGGTSGVKYLRKMLEVELFPELWNVRGEL